MRIRAGLVVAALSVAAAATAQDAPAAAAPRIWQVDLVPTGETFAASEPVLKDGFYTFQSWPEHATTRIKQARVSRVTEKIADPRDRATVYQIDLKPTGVAISRQQPTLKGNYYVYRTYREGTIMSVRQSDVLRITPLSGEAAYWAQERAKGETPIGPLAMQGGSAITIASPVAGSSQGGPTSASSLGRPGISGAPAGNWSYQGTPGTSDAWGPANATVSSPGGVPTMPAATSGAQPPSQPQ